LYSPLNVDADFEEPDAVVDDQPYLDTDFEEPNTSGDEWFIASQFLLDAETAAVTDERELEEPSQVKHTQADHREDDVVSSPTSFPSSPSPNMQENLGELADLQPLPQVTCSTKRVPRLYRSNGRAPHTPRSLLGPTTKPKHGPHSEKSGGFPSETNSESTDGESSDSSKGDGDVDSGSDADESDKISAAIDEPDDDLESVSSGSSSDGGSTSSNHGSVNNFLAARQLRTDAGLVDAMEGALKNPYQPIKDVACRKYSHKVEASSEASNESSQEGSEGGAQESLDGCSEEGLEESEKESSDDNEDDSDDQDSVKATDSTHYGRSSNIVSSSLDKSAVDDQDSDTEEEAMSDSLEVEIDVEMRAVEERDDTYLAFSTKVLEMGDRLSGDMAKLFR
jgi:hypothetical protein